MNQKHSASPAQDIIGLTGPENLQLTIEHLHLRHANTTKYMFQLILVVVVQYFVASFVDPSGCRACAALESSSIRRVSVSANRTVRFGSLSAWVRQKKWTHAAMGKPTQYTRSSNAAGSHGRLFCSVWIHGSLVLIDSKPSNATWSSQTDSIHTPECFG